MRPIQVTFILLISLLGMSLPYSSVLARPLADPSGYDLVAEVNSYRLQMGSYELSYNDRIAAAAQAHADWIVETGNGGHTGAGGTDETMRIMAAGYGNGKSIHCDEAWAQTSSASDAVYSAWADWTHQGVMLDYWGNGYTDAGGGVAASSSGYVFVFDICMISGQASSKAPTAVSTPAYDSSGNVVAPTEDSAQWVMSVQIATPAADGSIIHTIDYGQTLYSIATAYGVTIAQIRDLNYMADDATDIFPGASLVIKKADKSITGTPPAGTTSAESTADGSATITLAPSFTPGNRPTRTMPAGVMLATATATPIPEPVTPVNTAETTGLIIFTICGIGLGAFFLFGMKK